MAQWIGDFTSSLVSFDDVLLRPQFHSGESRSKSTDLFARLTKGFNIDIPIISANMHTITGVRMASAMNTLGGVGVLHRRGSVQEISNMIESLDNSMVVASIGVNNYEELFDVYKTYGLRIVNIDVAHGHSKKVLEVLEYIKKYSKMDVICGNVCTAEGTRLLCEHGADAIKVGIGGGSLCTTRLVTGHGSPTLHSVRECAEVSEQFDVPIIADGGIRNSSDIIKCLAAGADSVMLGSLLAGCDECPGEIHYFDCVGNKISKAAADSLDYIEIKKTYAGMASLCSMTGWRGNANDVAPEGESTLVDCQGPVEPIIKNLVAGIRSGLTYSGCSTIKELQENAIFQRVSPSVLIENRAHKLS